MRGRVFWGGGVGFGKFCSEKRGLYLPRSALDIASKFWGGQGLGKVLGKRGCHLVGITIIILMGYLRALQKVGCKKQPPVGCIVVGKTTLQGEGFCGLRNRPCPFFAPQKKENRDEGAAVHLQYSISSLQKSAGSSNSSSNNTAFHFQHVEGIFNPHSICDMCLGDCARKYNACVRGTPCESLAGP